MMLDQQPEGALSIDAEQLGHSVALEQGHEVVAADEVEHPLPAQPEEDGQRQVVAGLELVQAGSRLQQRLIVAACCTYPAQHSKL